MLKREFFTAIPPHKNHLFLRHIYFRSPYIRLLACTKCVTGRGNTHISGATGIRIELLEANEATHKCHAVELVFGELERLIIGVVGNDEDMKVV